MDLRIAPQGRLFGSVCAGRTMTGVAVEADAQGVAVFVAREKPNIPYVSSTSLPRNQAIRKGLSLPLCLCAPTA